MLEIHGWATMRLNNTASSEFEKCYSQLNEMMKETLSSNYFDIFKDTVINIISINITMDKNHLLTNIESGISIIDECVLIFEFIKGISPHSYGILYAFDDEDTSGNNNQFQVFMLKKGKIQEEKDPFLSPYIPTLEDPWENTGTP
jgi:hypothetical protein